MLPRPPFCVGLALWLCAWAAVAQNNGPVPAPTVPITATTNSNHSLADQRHALRQERARLDAALKAAETGCYQRFAVEDCLQAERRKARQGRMALQARENQLELAQRRQRAAERQQSIAARQQEHATSALAATTPRAAAVQRRKTAMPRPASSPPQAILRAQRQARQQAAAEHAVQAQQKLQAKQAAAQAHKAQLLRQQAERSHSGKPPAAPLPVPPTP